MAIVEECGLFGIITQTKGPVAESAYYGLYALQHRGQESCGIVVNDGGAFRHHKDLGLVNDVFTPEAMQALGEGTMATGHVTAPRLKQPLKSPSRRHTPPGSGAFGGNLNRRGARLELKADIPTTSDTEVIAYTVIKELIPESSRRRFPSPCTS